MDENILDIIGKLEDRINHLEERVLDLEQKKRRVRIKLDLTIEDYKKAFLKRMKEPDVIFEDGELVLWIGYKLWAEKRPDAINTIPELIKRQKRVSDILKNIKNYMVTVARMNVTEDDARVRTVAKNYFEYVVKYVEMKGEKLSFYQITSDYIFNDNFGKFLTWNRINQLEDKPA